MPTLQPQSDVITLEQYEDLPENVWAEVYCPTRHHDRV